MKDKTKEKITEIGDKVWTAIMGVFAIGLISYSLWLGAAFWAYSQNDPCTADGRICDSSPRFTQVGWNGRRVSAVCKCERSGREIFFRAN